MRLLRLCLAMTLITLSFSVPSFAEDVRQVANEAGPELKENIIEGGKDIKSETKKAGKQLKKDAKKTGQSLKEAGKDTGKGFKQIGVEIKNAVKGGSAPADKGGK